MATDKAALEEMASLRAEISEIDQQLMLLLGLRFRCTDQVSELEITHGQPSSQPDELESIRQVKEMALDAGVSPDLGVTLMQAVSAVVQENYARIKASQSH